jgi:hypothetical protein
MNNSEKPEYSPIIFGENDKDRTLFGFPLLESGNGFSRRDTQFNSKKAPECRKCIFARFDLEIDENRKIC